MTGKTKQRARWMPGRTFTALVLLLTLLLGLAWWRDWLAFSMASNSNGQQVDVTLTVDHERIRKDAEELVKEAREITRSMQELVNTGFIEGIISKIDSETGSLKIHTKDNRDILLSINASTQIRSASDETPTQLSDLKCGQLVDATFRRENAANVASIITVSQSIE